MHADSRTVILGGALPIGRMGFGTMRLPGPGPTAEPADPAAARHVLRRAVELGVNLIDTAAYYGAGVAERLIVEALHPYPAGLVIATKVGAARRDDGAWTAEARPEQLRAACEDNLRRLHLERIDLVHFRWMEDTEVPLAESLGALAELQAAGAIRHLGVSNVTPARLAAARRIVPIASVQNAYNVEDRAS